MRGDRLSVCASSRSRPTRCSCSGTSPTIGLSSGARQTATPNAWRGALGAGLCCGGGRPEQVASSHWRSPGGGLRLPAALRRRQPLLRLDDRFAEAPGSPPFRRRQPLHTQPAPGRARGCDLGRRSPRRASRGGPHQAAPESRQASPDRDGSAANENASSTSLVWGQCHAQRCPSSSSPLMIPSAPDASGRSFSTLS
jgi:hypothetical protein